MIRRSLGSLNDGKGNQCILVAKAIVSSIETLLGPAKSLKCCQSNGASIITSSTSKVLEHIDVEHPVGFIINDVCQSFQKQFGCGCTTLVCLIGYWAKNMQNLADMGVPVQIISLIMDEAFEVFKKVFESSYISLQSFKEYSHTKCATVPSMFVQQLTENCCLRKFTARKQYKNRSNDLTEMSGNNLLWYFEGTADSNEEVDNCSSVFKDKMFEVKRISEVKQSTTEVFKIIKGCRSQRKNSPQMLRGNSGLKSHFLETHPSSCDIAHCESSEHDVFKDDFEDCFDNVIEQDEDVKESNSQKTLLSSGKMKLPKTKKSQKSSIPQCLTNNGLLLKANYKANVSKISLRSRHLIGMKTLTLNDHNTKQKNILPFDSSVASKQHKSTSDLNSSGNNISNINQHDFLVKAHDLAHGKKQEMKFVLEILTKQSTSLNQNISILVDNIAVETIVGPPTSHSCVLDGVVVRLSKENQLVLSLDWDQPRSVMLINGDITFNYSHVGLQTPVEITRVYGKDDFSETNFNERDKWREKAILLVERLNLGVIMARGSVDNDLCDYLQGLGIIVLENMNYHQLQMIANMTNTPIISYTLDMEPCDLGKPVVIRLCVSGIILASHKVQGTRDALAFGQICLSSNDERKSVTQTLLICGPVPDLVADSELKFWNCVHRLQNAFDDNRVLPGGGEIERRCIKQLEENKGAQSDSCLNDFQSICSWTFEDYVLFKPLIYEALIKGLKEFISRVENNAARSPIVSNKPEDMQCVLDNYKCKTEGWKRAIRVVKLLLCSEYNIVTGI